MKGNKCIHLINVPFVLMVVMFITACSEDENELPVVETIDLTDITYNQVTVNGSIISNGGGSIIEHGVCLSTQPNPTISDFVVVSDSDTITNFSIELTSLGSNTPYYVRTYIENEQGISYGEELTFTLWLNVPEEPVIDIDNNSYSTVRIGEQVWMQENLKVTRYKNGDEIPYLTLENDTEWLASRTGAYSSYDDDPENSEKFGHLYNGFAATDDRCMCPEGWRVPSKDDWQTMIDYLGGGFFTGNLLKATTDWSGPCPDSNVNSTNLSGFTALPAGKRWHPSRNSDRTEYKFIDTEVFFSTTDAEEGDNSENPRMWFAKMKGCTEWAYVFPTSIKTCGQSVRCIRN